MTTAVAHDHSHGHAHDHDHDGSDHGHTHPHPAEDNSFAGKGAVLVDIGDGFGACIINAPEQMIGLEIEYRRLDVAPDLPLKHVAVVPRRTPSGKVLPTAVYPSLAAGTYEFYVRPNGDTKLVVDVVDGEIATRDWPET